MEKSRTGKQTNVGEWMEVFLAVLMNIQRTLLYFKFEWLEYTKISQERWAFVWTYLASSFFQSQRGSILCKLEGREIKHKNKAFFTILKAILKLPTWKQY